MPILRIQMTNLHDNHELVECDEVTANNYLVMAEMEEDVEDLNVKVDEPANIMQFSTYNVIDNQNDGIKRVSKKKV